MIPFYKNFLVAFVCLMALSACAVNPPKSSFYREIQPQGFLEQNAEIYWVPLNKMDYDLVDSCAAFKEMFAKQEGVVAPSGEISQGAECLATSELNAVFDFNNALNQSLDSLFDKPKELMPGLGGLPEEHTLLDSLIDQLAIEVDLFYQSFNQPEARQFCFENKITNKMRFLLSRLHVEYSIDFLATPLNVKTKVWSEARGFGEVSWDYTLAIWNLADPALIYLVNHREAFSPSGEERVDRNIFNKAKSKWLSDWTYLRGHINEECAKEDR